MKYFDKKEVGLRIKQLRRKECMTQRQLADLLCYATERQVQRIENGEISCPVDRLMEIAQIFDISTDYLLFGKEDFQLYGEGQTTAEAWTCKVIVLL